MKLYNNTNRLRELDFLRGLAILLVLLRHQRVFALTTNLGWIGVDLFFVLSGFLVSGLLFKEYIKFGNIKPINFLIRRSFKIYPIYYIISFAYIITLLRTNTFEAKNFLADFIFIQNYYNGWGYLFGPSWSLAVEEHFYLILAVLLTVYFNIRRKNSCKDPLIKFENLLIILMISILIIRIISNYYFNISATKLYTMTHLRIDSLLMGVLISYYNFFKKSELSQIYNKIKFISFPFLVIVFILIYNLDPKTSIFVRTIGFCLLYTGFAFILIVFVNRTQINSELDKALSMPLVNFISKIGINSYSIYVIHTLINLYSGKSVELLLRNVNLNVQIIHPLLNIALSIIAGIFITRLVETPFLKIRDKYFPNRSLIV